MSGQALVLLAAGVGVPILAALNAALGRHVASPAAAALVLFAVALTATAVVVLVTGPQGLGRFLGTPRHLLLGGVLVAFYILSVTYIAPEFGVGNAIFFILIGQLLSAAVIDHFGLFGAQVNPLSLTRGAGIAVMMLGVWLTQRA